LKPLRNARPSSLSGSIAITGACECCLFCSQCYSTRLYTCMTSLALPTGPAD
jgi:hypothetical protein